jgi:hypothetical protein
MEEHRNQTRRIKNALSGAQRVRCPAHSSVSTASFSKDRRTRLRRRRAQSHAPQSKRWAAERNMSSERNLCQYQRHERRGANRVLASEVGAVCSIPSQLRSHHAAILRNITVVSSVVVPSLGAQLRSSPHQRAACISTQTSLPCSRIAVQSHTSSSRPSAPGQSGPLPNKRFVPTANRLAPVGPRAVGAAAAQPQRWAI